jgi:hypothetical protein
MRGYAELRTRASSGDGVVRRLAAAGAARKRSGCEHLARGRIWRRTLTDIDSSRRMSGPPIGLCLPWCEAVVKGSGRRDRGLGVGAAVRRRTVSADGVEIAYWSSGAGPPLVLVHGGLGDHSRWNVLRPHLEPHVTVHALVCFAGAWFVRGDVGPPGCHRQAASPELAGGHQPQPRRHRRQRITAITRPRT